MKKIDIVIRALERAQYLLRDRARVGDVLPDAGVEQHGVLPHEADLSSLRREENNPSAT